jgi:hypothetical protein
LWKQDYSFFVYHINFSAGLSLPVAYTCFKGPTMPSWHLQNSVPRNHTGKVRFDKTSAKQITKLVFQADKTCPSSYFLLWNVLYLTMEALAFLTFKFFSLWVICTIHLVLSKTVIVENVVTNLDKFSGSLIHLLISDLARAKSIKLSWRNNSQIFHFTVRILFFLPQWGWFWGVAKWFCVH